MKKILFMIIPMMLVLATSVEARNDVSDFLIKDVQSSANWQTTVKKEVRLYFGKQKHSSVAHSFGDFSTNRKTNAFNKSDREACEWAFLSAIAQLQLKAQQLGGNAVINIRSNYNKIATSSSSTFKCSAGNIVAGVALKGTIVKLK